MAHPTIPRDASVLDDLRTLLLEDLDVPEDESKDVKGGARSKVEMK